MTPVDRYVVYGEIAAGGIATVHLGMLLGAAGFSRIVAIKRLAAPYARDPEFVAMFTDEARLAARVRHPNVVPTLDVVSANGELLLVMDYVAGESLARLLERSVRSKEDVPPALAANVIAAALHGLHAAHEATDAAGRPLQIVHRDVSPQNVLVGIDGVARVLDFGIAKALGRSRTTRDGSVRGKVAYMAPEQLQGKATRTSDVYSASVVLWEMLTRRRLFAADDYQGLVEKVSRGAKTRPGQLTPGIPAALEDVVMRGLSVDPDERFATAREMAFALEAAVDAVPASTVGAWVESLVGDILEKRAAMIAEVETASLESAATLPGMRAKAPSLFEFQGTSPNHRAPELPVAPPPPPRRRVGVPLLVAAIGVAIGVAMTVALAKISRDPKGPSDASSPLNSGATSTANQDAVAEVVTAMGTASVSAVASASVPDAAGSHTVLSSAPARRAPQIRKVDRCNPAYTEVVVDGRIRRVPKPECF